MNSEGIVCVGDSIINADKSWGYWLAEVTDQRLTRFSVGGSTSTQALDQLPALDGHRYGIACLTVGTNDVLFDWRPEVFEANFGRIVAALSSVADRVVTQTIPLRLAYFPGSGPAIRRRVEVANASIRDCGALVVDGSDLGGKMMSPDMIHPSVLGQLTLADRAAGLLGIEPSPSTTHDAEGEFGPGDYLRKGAVQAPKRLAKRLMGRAF